MTIEDQTPEDLTGVPQQFHAIVQEHGRALFHLVYATGLFQNAIQELAKELRGPNPHLVLAAHQYDFVANGWIEGAGYTPEQYANCRDAVERQLSLYTFVGREGRIVLDS